MGVNSVVKKGLDFEIICPARGFAYPHPRFNSCVRTCNSVLEYPMTTQYRLVHLIFNYIPGNHQVCIFPGN